MNITEQKLLEIIIEEVSLMENFLQASRGEETVPLDDKVIKAILSFSSKDKLNEHMLTEGMKEKIRDLVVKAGDNAEAVTRVAKRLALPAALVMSIWGGAMTGKYIAGGDSVSGGDDIELSMQDDEQSDETGISKVAGSAYDAEQFSGMDNNEKLEAAWQQFDLSSGALDVAPVSSSVWIYKYAMVPVDQIDNNTILPLIGASAADYYNFLKQRVEADPMTELPLLKNMVYGNVGKWSGGTGADNQNFKVAEDGSQILPPDWTVAFTVYGDIMEEKTIELVDYHINLLVWTMKMNLTSLSKAP